MPEAGEKELVTSQEAPLNITGAANRMVIRNANLTIVVADPGQVMEDIVDLADEFGGFVVNSQLFQRSTASGVNVQEASVTIRVPAERLDEARARIKSYVEDPKEDILADNISGQDVTQEYTDLQSRLRNEEAAAEQLRKIMETATKPEDVLRVFNELKTVNERIEVLKGQIKYYEEAAAMSAISVSIQAKETIEPISVAGWSPKGVARDALQALIDIYQFIASAAIWIAITCLPVAIPLGAVVFLIVRGVQRVRRKKKASQALETKE
jgi:tellurite resistance-related uncharacterized protein